MAEIDHWPGAPRSLWEVSRGLSIMPLSAFPAPERARINRLADAPEPPPKWLTLLGGMAQIPSRAWWEWHARRGRDPLLHERNPIPPGLRRRVIERDRGVCQLCHAPIGRDDTVHIDHVIPWSHGGPTHFDNLQLAHAVCNMRKGNRV